MVTGFFGQYWLRLLHVRPTWASLRGPPERFAGALQAPWPPLAARAGRPTLPARFQWAFRHVRQAAGAGRTQPVGAGPSMASVSFQPRSEPSGSREAGAARAGQTARGHAEGLGGAGDDADTCEGRRQATAVKGSKPSPSEAVVVGGRSPAPAMARGSVKSYSLAEGPRAPAARGGGESAAAGQTRGRFLRNRAPARGPQTHRRCVRSEHRERRAKGRTGGAVQAPSKAAPVGGRPGLPPQAACGLASGKGLRSGRSPRRPSAT